MQDADFALFNVDRLVTVAPGRHPAARGELGVIDRGALAAKDGRVVWVGPMDELGEHVRLSPEATVLNTHGGTVLPGFVDAHTHPVFAGDRTRDFYARARGQRYSEQVESGGLMHTVRATRAASEDVLLNHVYHRAGTFLQYGTTTIGARSGYGLTLDSELKQLRVLTRLQHLHPLKIVPGFLGAHVVPDDFEGSADDYVNQLIQDWMPAARECAEFVDVWCDDEAFTADQGRRILERGRDLGFALTAHANELGPHAGASMAAELGARSVDHAVYLEQSDIEALRAQGALVVLLPGTTFFLGSDRYAPARELVDAGVRVAVSTDYNPGTSFTQNMQLMLTLAVLKLGLSAEEAVTAATINGARALGLDRQVGSLEPGKYCDLAVYRVGDYLAIPYMYGMNLVESVVANGQVVVRDGDVLTELAGVAAP